MEWLGLAVIALLILGAALFAASIPLLWYLLAAALFFSGLIGPGLGSLLIGVIVHALWHHRRQQPS